MVIEISSRVLLYNLLFHNDLKISPEMLNYARDEIYKYPDEESRFVDVCSSSVYLAVINNPLLFSRNENDSISRGEFSFGFYKENYAEEFGNYGIPDKYKIKIREISMDKNFLNLEERVK